MYKCQIDTPTDLHFPQMPTFTYAVQLARKTLYDTGESLATAELERVEY
jgi:hypothetical protein